MLNYQRVLGIFLIWMIPSGKHTKSYWTWPSRNSGFIQLQNGGSFHIGFWYVYQRVLNGDFCCRHRLTSTPIDTGDFICLVVAAKTPLKNDGVRQWGWDDIPYIWVYNISLTWIKAIWGWFPLLTMIPVRSQWGRYNLPRYMKWKIRPHRFGGEGVLIGVQTATLNAQSHLLI